MSDTSTLTIEVSPDLKERLERLARDTRRSASLLAADAVSAYVTDGLADVEGIRRGLADVAAGRVVPHEQAMDELDAVIEAAVKRAKSLG